MGDKGEMGKKAITIESLAELRYMSGSAISPDGAYTAYVASGQDAERNEYESFIWLMDNRTREARQLTHAGKEGEFVWDGARSLLFPAARSESDKAKDFGEKTCFYRLDVTGGEARKAFEVCLKAVGIKPIGGGRHIICAAIDLNAPAPGAPEQEKKDYADYHVAEEIPLWANKDGYISRVRKSLFLYDEGAAEGAAGTAAPKKLTGDFFDVTEFDADGGRVLYAGREYRDRLRPHCEARCIDLAGRVERALIEPGRYGVDGVALAGGSAALLLNTFEPYGLCQLPHLYRYDFASGALELAYKPDRMRIGQSAVMTDAAYGGGNSLKAVGGDAYFIGQTAYRSAVYRIAIDGRGAGRGALGAAVGGRCAETDEAAVARSAPEGGQAGTRSAGGAGVSVGGRCAEADEAAAESAPEAGRAGAYGAGAAGATGAAGGAGGGRGAAGGGSAPVCVSATFEGNVHCFDASASALVFVGQESGRCCDLYLAARCGGGDGGFGPAGVAVGSGPAGEPGLAAGAGPFGGASLPSGSCPAAGPDLPGGSGLPCGVGSAARAGAAGIPARVTDINGGFFAARHVAEARHIPFTNSDGVRIDGWALEPFGFDRSKSYPGVLEIHGGPRCTFGDLFFHEMQALAGAGYFVLFCNPRGGEGYGDEFADLRGKYGTVDYSDLMQFTDHALARYPQLDAARLGAAGGSYGGFMCNWIEGHTDRFAAIASMRSVSNWVSDFCSSEIGITFDENEMGATPWSDHEKLWGMSPLKYACNAKTPILFIHSLRDFNCTIDQGVQMFAAVKYFGVPSRMCIFEGENHSLSRSGKPRHRARRLKEIFGWFAEYLKPEPAAEAEAEAKAKAEAAASAPPGA